MQAVGLITEYNPFHNGHMFHLKESLKITNADVCVAVMSGDYVQRGEPALLDKYTRAAMAINGGVNLVVELPSIYALSSAENFASGAVNVLNHIGVDFLVFGSECGNIYNLHFVAKTLIDNEEHILKCIAARTAKGESYAAARQKAVSELIGNEYADILSHSNNILAVEYIKALIKQSSHIKPYTIKRQGDAYNSTTPSGTYASATAIRKLLIENTADEQSYIPDSTAQQIINNNNYLCCDDFSQYLYYALLGILYKCNYDKNAFITELMLYPDINKEIAGRVYKNIMNIISSGKNLLFSEFTASIKTKEVPLTRINRCMLRIITGLDKTHMNSYINQPYIRILGFDKKGQEYLSFIKKKVNVPLISKAADYKEILADDIHCANLYNSVMAHKYNTTAKNDYKTSPIRIC